MQKLTAKQLGEQLIMLGDLEVVTTDNVPISCIIHTDRVFISTKPIIGTCNKCGAPVIATDSEGYHAFCVDCHEDMYGFEVKADEKIETPEYVYPTGFFNDDFTEFTNITVPVDSPNRKGKVVKSDLLEVNGVLSRGYVVQFRDHSQGYTDLLTKSRLVEVLLNTSHTFLVTKKQPYLNITKSDYVVFECRLPGVTSCRIGVSIKVSQAIDATESKTYEAAFEIVLQAVRYRIYESLPDLVVPSELTIRNDY